MNPFDELTEHFDHHDVAFMQDPVPGYTAMRARCPVAHSDCHGGFWIVADYDDLHNLYFDTDHFSSFIPTIPNSGHGERRFPLTMSDPPEHGLYRQIVQPWFTQSKMAEYEPEIRRRVTRLIDGFIERGEADLFWDFARKLPASVIADIMGTPYADGAKFEDWAQRITQATATEPESAALAYEEMTEYFLGLLAQREAEPRDDFITLLVRARVDDRPLGDEERVMFCILIKMAGFDTTSSFIGSMLWWLAEHPDQRARLLEDPALIPGAVDELLRCFPPGSPARVVKKDTEMHGQHLREGDPVLLLTASANRDESAFERADDVIFERRPNKHLGFGMGIHRCLGMHLARLESEVALTEILRRLPDYAIVPGTVVEWSHGQIWGPRNLPVTFTPGAPQASPA
ncbi:MAG: cytochrome P450 [Actinobacteria bacterium]|nr:MAG: cytochrome P450 [Actinomycetota bacterium]